MLSVFISTGAFVPCGLAEGREKLILRSYTSQDPTPSMKQTGWRGMLTRVKNPNAPIHKASAWVRAVDLTAKPDTLPTLYVGIASGSLQFSGTQYMDKMPFYAVAEAKLGAVGEIVNVEVVFDEPVYCDDEFLYVAVWMSDGSGLWLTGGMNAGVIAEDDEHPNYYLARAKPENERAYVRLGEKYSAKGRAAAFSLYTVEDGSEQRVSEFEERIARLEAGVMPDDNPLADRKESGGFANIFGSFTCIGDSLTYGTLEQGSVEEYRSTGVRGYDYPAYMSRALGVPVNNLGIAGATAMSWLKYALSHDYFAKYPADAYIIALGTNDIDSDVGGITGELTDINADDMSLTNTETDLGAYAAIIQNIKVVNPKAKIFIVTVPYTRNYAPWNDRANEKYRAVADMFGAYVIDLAKYGVQPEDRDAWREIYYVGGHLNALGYYDLAVRYMTYIDWIVRHNTADFKQAAFIQTEFSYTEN